MFVGGVQQKCCAQTMPSGGCEVLKALSGLFLPQKVNN